MASLDGRLKPIGQLAETVTELAKMTPSAPNSARAQKALKAAEPDLAAVVRDTNIETLVGRLIKSVNKDIVGQSALQALVELEINLEKSGLRMTTLDLSRCYEKMLQSQTGSGGLKFSALSAGLGTAAQRTISRQSYINFFSGELRERVVQHLPSVRILADTLTEDAKLRAKAAGIKRPDVIDSGMIGDVRMPTAPSSGRAPSSNALGPDRMFGFLVHDKKKSAGFAGTFYVTAIIEVKAKTGALDGLKQFGKFEIRALHGAITIDGKLYHIELDTKPVQRILIVPEDAINREETIAEAIKGKINVLPYPAETEKLVTQLAEQAVDNMLSLSRNLR